MNFLLRTAQPAVQDHLSATEPSSESQSEQKAKITLEGLIAEDPFPEAEEDDGTEGQNTSNVEPGLVPIYRNHSDVAEDEGWITIPYRCTYSGHLIAEELPNNWSDAPDILSFQSLDRSFVFPGEQVHLLACLSSSKQDNQIITPFKVAAVMSKNGILRQNTRQNNETKDIECNSFQQEGEENGYHQDAAACTSIEEKAEITLTEKKIDGQVVSDGESLLRMEGHRKQTESQLARFKNSHFFVRITESEEPLWSKKSSSESSSGTADHVGDRTRVKNSSDNDGNVNSYIDRGSFDATISGGVARNAVKCCSLPNGDIVVLLQINVGINLLKDPILEILQFEKYQDINLTTEKRDNLVYTSLEDPCSDLLKWLLPLDHTLQPPARPISPPPLNSSGIGSVSHKSSFSSSTGSQLFSFGHFRSYSMSSLPPNTAPPVTSSSSKPISELEDWDQASIQKPLKSQGAEKAGLQSFRGVSLEPERFSVNCGLEGIYVPGRRWRKKLEIIQPVEIHTFSAKCDIEDLISVQIKNVSPSHVPDIVIFLDAITIIFEEAPRKGSPVSLPIASIEAGNDCSLPNLALSLLLKLRDEAHSFILRPTSSMWSNFKAVSEKRLRPPQSQSRGALPKLHLPSNRDEEKGVSSSYDQYAILVSCRCNYTESRLFFKKSISWRPRVARDLMISVASEMSEQPCGPSGGLTQLPVQVLRLQVSNLTKEDLTMTVLAPASVTSPPSVVSLNSAPSTPMSPFLGFSEFANKLTRERRSTGMRRSNSAHLVSDKQKEKVGDGARSSSFNEQITSISDVIPSTGLGCTHLWLQSTVPLGCVPSQSTATVKIELLPLTDGIITLDTLQINVKEKGTTYIPEHSLKINATCSVATEKIGNVYSIAEFAEDNYTLMIERRFLGVLSAFLILRHTSSLSNERFVGCEHLRLMSATMAEWILCFCIDVSGWI
ncbi:hypothetical protein Syun_028304 [Stephania yunnanensis]|uniref:Uncharacterized protein n=1 Tax=Stephania yunnanensis TaxID=152371 RepID=A0AAP0EMQ6_9MAGN